MGSLGQQAAGLRAAFDRLEQAGKINRDKLILETWRMAMLAGKNPKIVGAKVKAQALLFDRWFGRAPISLEVAGADGKDLVPDELPAKLAQLVNLVASHRKRK